MLRITIIEDKNGGELILKDKTTAPINYAAQEIRNIASRKGTFSKTVTLAPTKGNAEKLGYYFKVNVNSVDFDVNKKLKVSLSNGNTPIDGEFYLQLTKIKRKSNRVVGYEVFIKGEVSDFFTIINQRYVEELDFSDGNHYLTNAEVLDRMPKNYGETLATYHLTANSDNSYELGQFKPAFFALDIFNRIHQRAGKSYTWASLSDEETRFDKLIIPTTKKESENEIESSLVVANRSNITVTRSGAGFPSAITLEPFTVNNEVLDVSGLYNPVTGVFQSAINIPTGAAVLFNLKMRLKHTIKNNDGVLSQLEGLQPLVTNYRFNVKKNGVQYSQLIAATATTPTTATIPAGGELTIFDQDLNFSIFASNFTTTDLMSLAVSLTNQLNLGEYQLGQRWLKPDNTDSNVTATLTCNNIELRIIQGANNGNGYGKYINLNSYLPKKVKQSDFIQSVMLMYNLIIDQELSTENNIVYIKRDEYYDSGSVKQWKLDKSKEYEYTFLSELTAKKKIISYKEDKDTINEAYKAQTNEVYGQVEYTFKSDFVKGVDTTELIFSPTPIIDTTFGAVVPALDGVNPDYNIRILYKGDLKPCAPYVIHEYFGSNTFVTTGYYPCTHFDDPIQPNFDLNLSTCDFYFYPYLERRTNNNLFNLNWRRQFSQIDNGRMLEGWFLIEELELKNLRLNHKIYCEGQYWNINKIIDADLENSRLTKCELISVEDLQRIPVRIRQVRPTGAGGLTSVSVQNLIRKVTNGLNSLPTLSNVQVIGKNVVVDQTVKNAIIIGDNVTASEDGVYTPKIIFPDGSTVETAPVGTDTNLGNTDLTATGNRQFDANGNDLNWIGLRQEKKTVSLPPVLGGASFEWIGSGTTAGDVITRIKSGAGTISESFGDKTQKFYGAVSFNNFGTASIQKNPNSQALMIVGTGSDGSYRSIFAFGNNDGEFIAQGDFGAGYMAQWINTGADYAYQRFQNGSSSSYYDFGMINSNFDIRGIIPSIDPSSATDIFRIKKSNGTVNVLTGLYTESKGTLGTQEAGAVFQVESKTAFSLPIPRMTESERNALEGVVEGALIYNKTRKRYEEYDLFWEWQPIGEITPDWGYSVFFECWGQSSNFFSGSALNGGTTVFNSSITTSKTQVFQLSTGVNANGEYRLQSPLYIKCAQGIKLFETYVFPPTLSDGTNSYYVQCGYLTTVTAILQNNGFYFMYDSQGKDANLAGSANWKIVSCNGGARTYTDTGVAVSNSAFQKLEIYQYTNKIEFYINGALAGTIATNLPTSTTAGLQATVRIVKTAGTTARLLNCNYIRIKEKFNTVRA